MNPESRIKELFAEYPDVIYGFSDTSYSPYGRQYRSAIVIAVPYGKQLTAETYREQDFEDGIQSAKARLESILQRLEALLQACGTLYNIPPVAQSDETDCVLCVEACPCKALHGVRWNASKQRSELIDYHRCNRMRSSFIPELGRKHACGRCFAACPFGIQEPGRHPETSGSGQNRPEKAGPDAG